jgi:hypothetical protein
VVTKEFLAIEFKRTQDMRSNHVDEITAVAQKQYKSLLMGLRAIMPQISLIQHHQHHLEEPTS